LGKAQDQVLLALIATLDEDAKKRGRKSVIKRVVSRLVAAGADEATVAWVAALRTPVPDLAADSVADSVADSAAVRATTKTQAKPRTKTGARAGKAATQKTTEGPADHVQAD